MVNVHQVSDEAHRKEGHVHGAPEDVHVYSIGEAAMLEARKKHGANSLLKDLNDREGAAAIERNTRIGGHRA